MINQYPTRASFVPTGAGLVWVLWTRERLAGSSTLQNGATPETVVKLDDV